MEKEKSRESRYDVYVVSLPDGRKQRIRTRDRDKAVLKNMKPDCEREPAG